jgi:dihydropteroate synthase-like protein
MPHYLFVTGKLAEPFLRRILTDVGRQSGFDYTVCVLPISVAALATTPWIARHLEKQQGIDRVVLPGLCEGDLAPVVQSTGTSVERGPKDFRDLPKYFGAQDSTAKDYGKFDIEILAEINHVHRLSLETILTQARELRSQGADIIDLGCDPGQTWKAARETVQLLRKEGLRVSIDCFNPEEVESALAAGAELVLSVNQSNVADAKKLHERSGCEFVAIPDMPATMEGLDATIQTLDQAKVPFRIDPVLEPIGFGFAASLGRYLQTRRRYPESEIMMGIGNLTELTDVDSIGINVLLLGFCQELGIRSVLTTQVIPWCQSCVRELDLARRLVFHACKEHVLPKHLEPRLVMLRDSSIRQFGQAALEELAKGIKDHNFRLFAENGLLHIMNSFGHWRGTDPFEIFDKVMKQNDISPSHAFYLGYEMAKAITALTLGKNYVQDQSLEWGFLTMPEKSRHGKTSELT